MQTPLTSQTPYGTVAILTSFCDVRTLGDYLGDTGARLTPEDVLLSGSPTGGPSNTNGVLYTLMLAATGDLESAVLVSDRYTPADLQTILNNGGAAAAKLQEMWAGLTLQRLFERRPSKAAPELPAVTRANVWLEALLNGTRIFGTQEAADAGLPETTIDQQTDVIDRRLSATILRGFFGRRARDHYQGPSGSGAVS